MARPEHASRRLKLRQIEVVLAVGESGSMAKAAERLAISQPVVSKTIADLENTLGIRLFDRDNHGAVPTLYGRALLQRGTALFNDLRATVAELETLSDPTRGELRIGASEAVAAGLLGRIVQQLSKRHPKLTFELTLGGGLTDLQHRELQAHNLDLIIGRLPEEIPGDVEAEVLYQDRAFVLAASGGHTARRRKLRLADLADEPWALPPFDSYPGTLTAEAFRAAGARLPSQIVTTRSILMLTGLASSGRFLTILPKTVLQFYHHGLRILPIDLAIRYPVGVMTLKHRTPSPAVPIFVTCAREICRSLAKAGK